VPCVEKHYKAQDSVQGEEEPLYNHCSCAQTISDRKVQLRRLRAEHQ